MKRGLDPRTGYARYANEYDEKEKFWESFEKGSFNPYIEAANEKKVLDAGAGTGRVSLKLAKAGAHVTALDISPDMLGLLEQKDDTIKTVIGDMENMPFEDESFDMVFSSMAMVHLKKVDHFLDECYRVLKDDGIMVLLNIHYRKPQVLYDEKGKYTIACYNHFPRHVVKAAEKLAFGIEKNELITEGDDVWVSQLLVMKR